MAMEINSAISLSASRIIADWTCGSAVEFLPAEAWLLVKRAMLDTLAVSLSGSMLSGPRIVAQTAKLQRSGPVVSVYGMGCRTDLLNAALINGTSAHADLFDDNNAPMIAHPSAPLVSSLMALAQSRNLGGRGVIEAYAVGFEVGVSLGRLLNPGLYEKGWHATRVLGLIGSTAACCRLIRLDPVKTASALGIAVSMASGVRQNFGTMTMALHVGLTARDAIHCALLAEAGMQSDEHSLDGKYGFFEVFADLHPEKLEFGNPFELLKSGIIFKPYPSGAPTHAAVDAALTLHAKVGGHAGAIARVDCLVHRWNAMTLRDEEPKDMLQAKVSLRYCVAAALVHGELTFRQFTAESLQDPELLELMKKITVQVSDNLPDNGEFPAEIFLQTVDGRTLQERREVPPGGSTRPLSYAAIVEKFRSCSQLVLDTRAAESVVDVLRSFESLDNVHNLCEILQGQAEPA